MTLLNLINSFNKNRSEIIYLNIYFISCYYNFIYNMEKKERERIIKKISIVKFFKYVRYKLHYIKKLHYKVYKASMKYI